MTKTKIVVIAIMVILWFLLLPIGKYTQNEEKAHSEAPVKPREEIKGKVSWYDYSLETKDQKCSQGEVCYSKIANTCASRDYPRGTELTVIYETKERWEVDQNYWIKVIKTVSCRVNDYGPEEETGRILDLSSHAFEQFTPLSKGILDVKIEVIK